MTGLVFLCIQFPKIWGVSEGSQISNDRTGQRQSYIWSLDCSFRGRTSTGADILLVPTSLLYVLDNTKDTNVHKISVILEFYCSFERTHLTFSLAVWELCNVSLSRTFESAFHTGFSIYLISKSKGDDLFGGAPFLTDVLSQVYDLAHWSTRNLISRLHNEG